MVCLGTKESKGREGVTPIEVTKGGEIGWCELLVRYVIRQNYEKKNNNLCVGVEGVLVIR